MNTDTIAGLKALWKEVFGDPEAFIDTFFAIAFSPDRCHYALEGTQAVSALYWLDCTCNGRKLAYIYAVATAPSHRGQGLASRLLTETHDLLKRRGYAGAVLKPAQGLFPFYKRLGYATSGFVRFFDAQAGSPPAALQELSSTRYAALRRSFLPKNGVIQEGVTLDFLHSFARFYSTEDALITVSRDEPVILEYLGNPDSAPGILAALGIASARLRTFGGDIPFTLYHPLEDAPAPGYLGITLE